MAESDIQAISNLIKIHANLTIIFEATARLLKQITELTSEFNKQSSQTIGYFSRN